MTPSDNFNEDLDVIDAAADVVVDMFLDPNQETANSTTLPKYEIMVWIAAFGGKKPIGYNSSLTNLPTYSLGGANLYASRSPLALHTSADR
jgi:xyloglucan-specific endo-beta-1,4-glucanase